MELGYLSQVGLGTRDLDILIIVPVRLLRENNLKTSSLPPHSMMCNKLFDILAL
jgi:hypothetical protein